MSQFPSIPVPNSYIFFIFAYCISYSNYIYILLLMNYHCIQSNRSVSELYFFIFISSAVKTCETHVNRYKMWHENCNGILGSHEHETKNTFHIISTCPCHLDYPIFFSFSIIGNFIWTSFITAISVNQTKK